MCGKIPLIRGQTNCSRIWRHLVWSKRYDNVVIASSIDVAYDFLDGIYVTDVNPAAETEYDVDEINQHIFEFNYDIGAGASVDVTFTATAVKTGDFGGDFDICIDGDISCIFRSIRTIVE